MFISLRAELIWEWTNGSCEGFTRFVHLIAVLACLVIVKIMRLSSTHEHFVRVRSSSYNLHPISGRVWRQKKTL